MNIAFKNPAIKFYFSFQCPYSYIAFELLRQLLKGQSATVAPIEIGHADTNTAKCDFRSLWGEERWQRLIKDALACGLHITAPAEYASSLIASSAIEAYGASDAEEYIICVFKAVFFRHIDISSAAALRLHLQSEGLDSSIFLKAVKDSNAQKAAQDKAQLWQQERIRMTPTLEIEQERYAGFIDKFGLERYLRSILE